MHSPAHPGRVLRRYFHNRAQADAAAAEGIDYPQLVAIYQGAVDITPEMAAKLDRVLGTSDGFWLKMQAAYDAWLRDPRSKLVPIEN